jgi:hypothetical protein
MQRVQAYKASDGALFHTEEECREHEASLLWRDRIGEFLESPLCPYRKGAHVNMTQRIIVGWEQFKESRAATPADKAP